MTALSAAARALRLLFCYLCDFRYVDTKEDANEKVGVRNIYRGSLK